MNEFLAGLTSLQMLFLGSAIVGGIIFGIRMLLLFIGHHGLDAAGVQGDGEFSVDHADADSSFTVLSLQGLSGFFLVFGLVGLALSCQSHTGDVVALCGAFAAGSFTVWLIGRIFTGMGRLQADGTLKIENAVGQEGTVYLRIAKGGTGKAQVEVQGQLRTFEAVTDGEELKTGERVKVERIAAGHVLVVKSCQR